MKKPADSTLVFVVTMALALLFMAAVDADEEIFQFVCYVLAVTSILGAIDRVGDKIVAAQAAQAQAPAQTVTQESAT